MWSREGRERLLHANRLDAYIHRRYGHMSRVLLTTMGASVDLVGEDLQQLLVSATYWTLEMEEAIPERAAVTYVGD